MFSEASVSHSVHMGVGVGTGRQTALEEDHHWRHIPRHLVAAIAAVGTHPTGIHSCL